MPADWAMTVRFTLVPGSGWLISLISEETEARSRRDRYHFLPAALKASTLITTLFPLPQLPLISTEQLPHLLGSRVRRKFLQPHLASDDRVAWARSKTLLYRGYLLLSRTLFILTDHEYTLLQLAFSWHYFCKTHIHNEICSLSLFIFIAVQYFII